MWRYFIFCCIFSRSINSNIQTKERRVMTTDEFEKLCRDSAPMVYRFLLSLCGDPELAQELTSETFYQAYLHIDRFRGDCKPESWLCQIAKNALFRERRRRKRLVPWEPSRPREGGGDVLESLADREEALTLYRYLHQLEDPYREVFLLRVLGELKFGEIAAIYGRTESWAKVTFYRAKEKLIKRMEEGS